ncbi:MAG: DUF1993 domain-containing protein [Alphaproteobacteria bacterium]
MTLSMYQASVPVFTRMLNALSAILEKAETNAAERRIDQTVLVGYRLAPDMFPLSRQVQIATDHAKGCVARLSGAEPPKYSDDEATLGELRERITKTLAFVQSKQPADVDGSEEREITLSIGGQAMHFQGQDYLLGFVLPNFYFHVTAAYAILRHCGVPIGKRDFMGMS